MILALYTLIFLVNPLILDPNLSQIAENRAEIVYNTEWSHKGWKDSFKDTGCSYIAENLAKDFKNAHDIHNAFMSSQEHRDIILNTKYQLVGIGKHKNITVELFCGKY